jgi:hypothetical protein
MTTSKSSKWTVTNVWGRNGRDEAVMREALNV